MRLLGTLTSSWVRVVAASLLALSILAGAGAPVAAHALLVKAVPAAGTSVAVAPGELVLTFTEAIDPALSRVLVLDAAGVSLPVGELHPDPQDQRTVSVTLPPPDAGTYTVAWRTVSSGDGHQTSGSFAFGVGVPEGSLAQSDISATTIETGLSGPAVVGRWLLLVGLFGMLGATTVTLVVERRILRITFRFITVAWAAAVAGTIVLVAARVADAGVAMSDVVGTSVGTRALARTVPLVVVAMALLLRRRTGAALALVIVLLAAAGGLLVESLTGHWTTLLRTGATKRPVVR